jgi:predicted metal-binding protein
MREKIKIQVCFKCRTAKDAPEPISGRSGSRFLREIEAAAALGDEFEIEPVECFSVCKRPVTIGLPQKGKWQFLYGDFPPHDAQAIAEVFDIARRHHASENGIVPKEGRTASMREKIIARFPPGQ